MLNPITHVIILIPLIALLVYLVKRLHVKVLKVYNSTTLGQIKILQRANGEKMLSTNYFVHGISTELPTIKQSYWYAIAKKTVQFCEGINTPKILVLGLGANTITSLIAKQNAEIHQTIVERDPMIIQACKDFFRLDQIKYLTLIQEDVFELIKNPDKLKDTFDVIVIDIFSDQPPFISMETGEPTFVDKLKHWVAPQGVLIFNRVGHTKETLDNMEKLKAYLTPRYKDVNLERVDDPRGYRNYIISAKEIIR